LCFLQLLQKLSDKNNFSIIGRAGKSGKSITFIDRGDWSHASELIDLLKEANQEVPGILLILL